MMILDSAKAKDGEAIERFKRLTASRRSSAQWIDELVEGESAAVVYMHEYSDYVHCPDSYELTRRVFQQIYVLFPAIIVGRHGERRGTDLVIELVHASGDEMSASAMNVFLLDELFKAINAKEGF